MGFSEAGGEGEQQIGKNITKQNFEEFLCCDFMAKNISFDTYVMCIDTIHLIYRQI